MSEDSNNRHNGSGNGHDPDHDESDNIVRMPSLAERDRMRRQQEKEERRKYHSHEPAINLPFVTKYAVALFLIIHICLAFFADPEQKYWVYEHLGFVPGVYMGETPFYGWAYIAPLTFMLLHGSWVHVILNSVMMTAFGAGVERWMGGKRMVVFFILCSLGAALTHFLLSPSSLNPMIGASGGISGLFAAVLIMMQSMGNGAMGGRYGIWPFVGLWIIISLLFGFMGGPDGSAVAWAAHIGGFLFGFVFLKPVIRFIK